MDSRQQITEALWRVYRRPARPQPWTKGGNLPWDDPAFSQRMLAEHLDQSHGAASRTEGERRRQMEWLWPALKLDAGSRLLDLTCGPGLYAVEFARRGCQVTGVDFAPAAIAYAQELAQRERVSERCQFIQQDARRLTLEEATFDAALILYGQLAVFPREEAEAILRLAARALKPGGRLCLELLDQKRVDKKESSWWYTDDAGLWGDAPYLHLGERFWLADEALSIERFQIIHLETGQMDEIHLCDQSYAVEEMKEILIRSGFRSASAYPAWAGLPLYDAAEWVVYLAER